MIKLRLDRGSATPIHQQLREQIQAALHMGRLRPGDRLPSLRQMSVRYGLNPKTILRAYRTLSQQGLIVIRPGSGAMVQGDSLERREEERAILLTRLARRQVSEARSAGLTQPEHVELLTRLDPANRASVRATRARVRIVVLECNSEQATTFSRELARRVGVQAHPLVLPALDGGSEAILGMADFWVTTDFHYSEVGPRARRKGRPCVTLRLDPRFPRAMIEAAKKGSVLMIVEDLAIVPAFRRALESLGTPESLGMRIRGVRSTDLALVRRELTSAESVYVSPLCPDEVRALVPRSQLVRAPVNLIDTSSMEALRAMLLVLSLGNGAELRRGSV